MVTQNISVGTDESGIDFVYEGRNIELRIFTLDPKDATLLPPGKTYGLIIDGVKQGVIHYTNDRIWYHYEMGSEAQTTEFDLHGDNDTATAAAAAIFVVDAFHPLETLPTDVTAH